MVLFLEWTPGWSTLLVFKIVGMNMKILVRCLYEDIILAFLLSKKNGHF